MGMYTEVYLAIELKRDTPQEIINVLKFLAEDTHELPFELIPDHPFFKCERWRWLFSMSSAYHPAAVINNFWQDDISKQWLINIHSSIKNYDQEIQKFCDWIAPYVNAYVNDINYAFLGFMRYVENEMPTPIFLSPNGIIYGYMRYD